MLRWMAMLLALTACHAGAFHGPPSQVLIAGGDAQSGTAGQELPDPLRVRVVDAHGNPVPGQLVNFKVTTGGGGVFAGASLTNADGVAQERWTLGTRVGDPQAVECRAVDSSTGAEIVFATFSASVLPGEPAVVLIVAGDDQIGPPRATLQQRLQASVSDRYLNAVPSYAVSWTSDDGDAIQAASATDASGITSAKWILGPAGGTRAATVTAQGVSVRFHSNVPASVSVVSGDQQSAQQGTAPSQELKVVVTASGGRPLPMYPVAWNADSGGSVDAATGTDASGMATATWTLGLGGGTQTATVTAGVVTSSFHATSRAFYVLAADLQDPANLVIGDGRAYWTEPGALRTLDLSNPLPQTIAASTGVTKIQVDNGRVYWSDSTGIHALDEANLGATPQDLLAWSQVDAGTPTGAFAISGDNAYLMAQDNLLRLETFPKTGLPGGTAPQLLTSNAPPATESWENNTDLIVDGQSAFWNGMAWPYIEGTAYQAPLDGGSAIALTKGIGDDLVIENGYLYGVWWQHDQPRIVHGVALTSTPAYPPPPPGLTSSDLFAVDQSNIYSTNGEGIYATDLFEGGTRAIDPGGEETSCCIAIDAENVYWLSAGELRKAGK